MLETAVNKLCEQCSRQRPQGRSDLAMFGEQQRGQVVRVLLEESGERQETRTEICQAEDVQGLGSPKGAASLY